jgi:hypothetical protein
MVDFMFAGMTWRSDQDWNCCLEVLDLKLGYTASLYTPNLTMRITPMFTPRSFPLLGACDIVGTCMCTSPQIDSMSNCALHRNRRLCAEYVVVDREIAWKRTDECMRMPDVAIVRSYVGLAKRCIAGDPRQPLKPRYHVRSHCARC